MAPMSTQTGSSLDGQDRRICARQQVKSLAYLDIGADNGGIVLNISESGVAVHAVSVLPAEPLVDLRLQLPRSSKRLETKGKVAWTSSTKKEAGVEFIELPEEVRLEIRDWLASENLEPVYIESSPDIESSARPPARRDKWTNLVSELSSIPAGIDRVTDDRTASTRPVSVPESLSNDTTVAPSLPDLNAVATSQETVFATPARGFGLTESLTAESLMPDSLTADQQNAQSNSESNSIAAPELTDRLSSNSDPIRDQQYRKGDLELTLPSDKLLNTSLHPIAIVPSRGNKIDNAKPSRNLRDSGSGASDGDAFLRKARALFGPKHLEAQQPEIPEIDDSASPLESVEPALAALPAEAVAEQAPAPMSDLIATSTPASEPSIPSTLRPVTSIPLDPSASRGTEAKRRSASLPATRGLDLRSFLSILALCVLLSVVCLAFGIVVGRGVATRSTNAMANRDEVKTRSTQGTAAQGQGSSISNRADTSAPLSQGHDQLRGRTSAQRPHEAAHRRLPVQQTDDTSSASLAGETDAPADNAAVAAVGGIAQGSTKSTVTPPSAAATSTPGTSTVPAPAPASTSVPAPRSQPPSDRMVAAYLIYRVEPIYPRAALHAGVEGTVKIHATVGREGAVKNLKVVSGPDLLAPAAIEAAQYWRYIPALRNGEPVETDADISVEFHLPH